MGPRQLELEEDALDRQLYEGEISIREYNAALHELHRDYDAAAEEAAREAYERERDRW